MILLDTHVLLWSLQNPQRLGAKTRRMLEKLVLQDAIAISAVSFFEVAVLVHRRRALAAVVPSALRTEFLSRGGKEIAIDGEIAVRAGELQTFRDPFDRLITATAEIRDLHLITADDEILDWRGSLHRWDARN